MSNYKFENCISQLVWLSFELDINNSLNISDNRTVQVAYEVFLSPETSEEVMQISRTEDSLQPLKTEKSY